MTDLNAPDYYRRREQQERALARAATSPAIQEIHLELADRYAHISLVAETSAPRPRLRLVNAS
jgi:hypothetical protein